MTCAVCGVLLPASPTGRPARYCSNAHRQAAYRTRIKVRTRPVLAAMTGTNADLFREVARLRIPDGSVVADVTYGRGTFWQKIDTSRFTFLPSDLEPRMPGVMSADFRHLPYADGTIDVVVLDPPYVHNADSHFTAARQYNGQSVAGLDHDGIMGLYAEGLAEAARVLRPGGVALVKCQPMIESGRARWSDIEVHDLAAALGMTAADRFTLVRRRPSSPPARWDRQVHARRNESMLWIFVTRRDARTVTDRGAA